MSRENVEIVRRATDAYDRRAFDEVIEWLDPGIEWDMTRVDLPDLDVYRGFDELLTFHEMWEESWEWVQLEPREFIDAGDHVISVVCQRGRGRLSGVEVEQSFGQVWTVRDGKIVRMEMHPTREAALEAVGLRT